MIYEVGISILAIISVIIAILDLTTTIPEYLVTIDTIVLIIFVIDYFTRLIFAPKKLTFIKGNLFDLIAIIPFSSFFRIFRAAKLFRLLKFAKLLKLSRLIAVTTRLVSHLKVFMDTNGFKYMLMISGILVVIGGTAIHFAEGMPFADGIWWAFVTATTVGYGDISPATSIGRIIAGILMLCGIGLIGSLTSTITSFFMNGKNKTPSIEDLQKISFDTTEYSTDELEDIKKYAEFLKEKR